MDIAATATSFFGSSSAESIFSSGQSASITPDQQSAKVIISAHKREINRIRGYKEELTPTDNNRLTKLAEKISAIAAKANAGTVRPDELKDRTEYLQEADRIIGKPTVDLEVDITLAGYNNLKLAILEPKLDPATAKRVAFLERFKNNLEDIINSNPDRLAPQRQFQSVAGLIDQLKPLRLTTDLSRTEAKTYDNIVNLMNDHVGHEIELSVKDSNRVIALERSIALFQGSLGPDLSQQPTPQAVANAYVSLSR